MVEAGSRDKGNHQDVRNNLAGPDRVREMVVAAPEVEVVAAHLFSL